MALKVETKGGKGGNQWDDGSDYEGVTKIHVRGGLEGIQFIKFEYVKAGNTSVGPIHGVSGRGFTQTFEIDHLNKEHLVSVKGCYDNTSGVIQALQFQTNLRSSEVMGFDESGTKFTLEAGGNKIIGFHGSSETNLMSLGAYFTTLPPIKLEHQGGRGGYSWDHGVYTGVRKVYVTYSPTGISHIMVDYDKAGKVETCENGDRLGENRVQGEQKEFALDYPNEYITYVVGTCDLPGSDYTNRVRSLSFKTSKGRISPTYGKVGVHTFVLESKGRALVGFHGWAGYAVDGIGAYFGSLPTPPPSEKLEHQGGRGGYSWDHGVYIGVKKVYVKYSPTGISHIMVDYDKAGKVETRENGDRLGENRVQGEQKEFALDYPNEYITSVVGTCDLPGSDYANRVRSLSFKTSKGRISPTYGKVGNHTFVLESKGRALVGFHGWAGYAVDAIGAYFGSLPSPPPPPPSEKLQGKGGEGGASWDDGVFDGVRKIFVGQGENGVASVKFVYDKNNQVVAGEDHGKMTMLGYEEFELDYPSEYILAVEGCYDKIFGSESTVITMLKFKTNVRTSPPFGLESTSSFVLGKEGHKIVGFHGKASDELHQFGVSVAPITK